MPSPFPGMDPFVESSGSWSDCHANLISAMRADLNAKLPPGFAASTGLYVWIHEPDASRRLVGEPDVLVRRTTEPACGPAGVVQTAPCRLIMPAMEMARQRYLEIRDLRNQRVVTVVELLSPTNQRPIEGREGYLTKRHEYLIHGVNLVEIDLLRGEPRLPLGTPPPPVSAYYALVSEAHHGPEAGFWPIGLRDPLPNLPISLSVDAPPVVLELGCCFTRAYDEGRYADRLRYDAPVTPPLDAADAEWAQDLLRRAGLLPPNSER